MKVLRQFSRLVEAVERIASQLGGSRAAIPGAGQDDERLRDLELRQSKWEAEVEAVLMKAEGKLQAANNSEARERTMRKSYENLVDPLGLDSEAAAETERVQLQRGNDEAFDEEGVHPMHMDVEEDYRSLGMRAKFS